MKTPIVILSSLTVAWLSTAAAEPTNNVTTNYVPKEPVSEGLTIGQWMKAVSRFATPIRRPDGTEISPKFHPCDVPWILRYVSDVPHSRTNSPLNDCSRVVRIMLGSVDGDKAEIKEGLVMGFHDSNPQVRCNALLGMVPPFFTGEDVKPFIRTALQDSDGTVRSAAFGAWVPFVGREGGGSLWPRSLYPHSRSEATTNLIRPTER
ncbi:MAG: hypothetical protein AB9869_27240 [Verrucomicrobiia bacterium]